MSVWLAAMVVGLLFVGLRNRSGRTANRLVPLVIVVVLSYEAAKLHAI